MSLEISQASLGVESLVIRLQKDLLALDVEQEEYDERWFSAYMDHLVSYSGFERGFGHAKALALAILSSKWEKVNPQIKKEFGYTFKSFATTRTGRDWSTIDNWVRTANVWLGKERISYPSTVRVTARRPDGSVLKDVTGKVQTEDVEFNPWLVDFSKLLRLNSRASKGDMTPRLWELLADPVATCEDIDVEMVVREDRPVTIKFVLAGPVLLAREGEEEAALGELDFEPFYYGEAENLHKRALERLFSLLGITLDEDQIIIEQHRKDLNDVD